jgi:hypothetical protein
MSANYCKTCGFDRTKMDLDGGPSFCDKCVAAIERMEKKAEDERIQRRRTTDS